MKKTLFILFILACISLFFNLYKMGSSPPSFNTDEAADGYNAYSILKTGKDEYGNLLPLRLKSFGDYKMPLYSYLSIPFIAIGGLNETSTRALNSLISFLFPFVIFAFTFELFGKKIYGYLAAFLFSLSPGIQLIGRQAHEAYLTTFLIILSLWLFLKIIHKSQNFYKLLFSVSLILLSFGYHFSRLWLGVILLLVIYFTIKRKLTVKFFVFFLLFFVILNLPDLMIKPERVKNLLFFNNQGLGLQTAELRSEGGSRFFYNKLTVGLKNFLFNHFTYYSPQFLVINGDDNRRFSYQGISPITLVEYIFIFVGIYYLFKDKQKYRGLLTVFLILAPLPGSLSWAGLSITRILPLIVFINIVVGYGLINFIEKIPKKIFLLIGFICLATYLIFAYYSWDFYFNHYSKRAFVIRAWQSGNREMAQYVKNNYENFDRFYISRKNGQPYIFILFYLQYPPEKYQKQAALSSPDEFGFGQVEQFDKFDFRFQLDPKKQRTAFIGYPEDFNQAKNLTDSRLKKIKVGTEEIFWVYEQ